MANIYDKNFLEKRRFTLNYLKKKLQISKCIAYFFDGSIQEEWCNSRINLLSKMHAETMLSLDLFVDQTKAEMQTLMDLPEVQVPSLI